MPDPASNPTAIARRFRELYGETPRIFRAPGRVNLIGEHTDYNDGFVMPMAIEFSTWVAIAPARERVLSIYSDHFNETVALLLDQFGGPPRNHWSDYMRGVAALLQSAGYPLIGANLIIHGEVPLGAGLSSSASVEIATALALLSLTNSSLPPRDLAVICQRAEHEFVGTRCGLMDQFISVFGREAHALLLDCRSLDFQFLPIPADACFVVCNSMVKHELAVGEYNRRRADCESAVRIIRHSRPEISALRDVTVADLDLCRAQLSDVVYLRCRHVITENGRVLAAGRALESSDLNRFGRLMYESHRSMRDDYEISCREIDMLVDAASRIDGVYGARMTGGGFGGCTVNLIRMQNVAQFQQAIVKAYKNARGITPSLYVCSPAKGAGESAVTVEELDGSRPAQ